MAAIDVGAAAVDREDSLAFGNTYIGKENPANLGGKITKVAVWILGNAVGVKAAIFQNTSGDIFTARDSQLLGDLGVGYHEIAVDLDVEAGDYIGVFVSDAGAGKVVRDLSGEGYWYLEGDQTACTDTTFTWTADRTISAYGTGGTLGGWSGKIAGVTNPVKIMGVAKEDISKVKGVV